jgi:hypothetical protein
VLADANDYHLARHLISGPLSRQLGGGLSDPARRFLQQIEQKFGSREFTSREAIQNTKASKRSVYGWLAELFDAGAARVVEAPKGPKPGVWQVVGWSDEAITSLPTAKELFPC